jgi:hypothetical protein
MHRDNSRKSSWARWLSIMKIVFEFLVIINCMTSRNYTNEQWLLKQNMITATYEQFDFYRSIHECSKTSFDPVHTRFPSGEQCIHLLFHESSWLMYGQIERCVTFLNELLFNFFHQVALLFFAFFFHHIFSLFASEQIQNERTKKSYFSVIC